MGRKKKASKDAQGELAISKTKCGTLVCGCAARGPAADLVWGENISPVFFLAVSAARMANREILRPALWSAPPRGWVPLWEADLGNLLLVGSTSHVLVPDGSLFGYAQRPASMVRSTHVVGVGINRQEGDVRPRQI